MSMSSAAIISHNIRTAFETISQAPTDWPYIFFLPVLAVLFIASQQKYRRWWNPWGRGLLFVGSISTLLGCFYLDFRFLTASFLTNSYATLFAMTAWLYHLGHPIYSTVDIPAPYSLPYGPYGFIIVSFCQQLLGPSIFASKLPAFIVSQASSIFLYLSLRSRINWLGALFLTALSGALLLPFDPFQFWPRPDPFLVFAAVGGLWASTRRGMWGLVFLGFFVGFAVNLKIYALVFFFLPFAVAARNVKTIAAWGVPCFVAFVVAIVPFFWSQVSIVDYLRVIKMDSNTYFQNRCAIQSAQWFAILIMIGFSPLFVHKWEGDEALAVLRRNVDFSGALLLSFLFVSYPCCEIDFHHLMPLVPISAFLAAHLYSQISARSLFERAPGFAGASMLLSVVCFMGCYTLFQDINESRNFREREIVARERIADIQDIYNHEGPCILVNVSGSNHGYEDDFFYRAILVFNGMPIGIDPTASMDYRYFGRREVDFENCLAEIESEYKLPIVCICANNTLPFSLTSYFPPQGPVFSDQFIIDFYRHFEFSRHSSCFDIYTQKADVQ